MAVNGYLNSHYKLHQIVPPLKSLLRWLSFYSGIAPSRNKPQSF